MAGPNIPSDIVQSVQYIKHLIYVSYGFILSGGLFLGIISKLIYDRVWRVETAVDKIPEIEKTIAVMDEEVKGINEDVCHYQEIDHRLTILEAEHRLTKDRCNK